MMDWIINNGVFCVYFPDLRISGPFIVSESVSGVRVDPV